jgi:hypothetical protein
MSGYVLKKLTGWTPDLTPPPGSPLYQWRWLAGSFSSPLRDEIGNFAVAMVAPEAATR